MMPGAAERCSAFGGAGRPDSAATTVTRAMVVAGAAGGEHGCRDRQHDPGGDRPPRQVRRIDHVAGVLLQR